MEKELRRKIRVKPREIFKSEHTRFKCIKKTENLQSRGKLCNVNCSVVPNYSEYIDSFPLDEIGRTKPSSCSTPISNSNKRFDFDQNIGSSELLCTKKKVEIQMGFSLDNEDFDSFSPSDITMNENITKALLSANGSLLETIDCCHEIKNNFTSSNLKLDVDALKNDRPIDLVHVSSPDIFQSTEESFFKCLGINDDRAWDMSTTITEEECKPEINHFSSKSFGFGLSDLEIDKWSDRSMIEVIKTPRKELDLCNTRPIENVIVDGSKVNCSIKKTCTGNIHSRPACIGSCEKQQNQNSFHGLPLKVKHLMKKYKGIDTLYEWQEECLNLPAIQNRTNLVYALPTSGGKTLVAEILILRELLCREKNVLFILPYVSIAQEKVRALSPLAVELGFHVEEYAGSKGAYPPKKRRRKHTVYIATIEKGLGLIHSLIENERLKELGLVVVDELHLIGEQNRGANLESVLSKIIFLEEQIQIIGMSATIGNLAEIARFLQAETYTQDFRPVELTEYVKVAEELFKVEKKSNDLVPLIYHSNLTFPYSQEMQQLDPDQVGGLVREVVPDHSCLVFCPSKKNCENVASLICRILDKKILEHKLDEKKSLYNALLTEGNGSVCATLCKTLPYGIAYHHSGLTTAERSLLEEAFLAKTLCCICCTSTLAAGVNLPAKRVILRSPYIGMELISFCKYKQMVGRAGRAGLGNAGESFLLCKPSDTQKVGALLSSSIESCQSQLEGVGLYNLVLSALALSITKTDEDLFKLFDCTLLSEQASHTKLNVKSQVTDAVNQLIELGGVNRSNSSLVLTPIGKAAVKGNFDLTTAKTLYADLKLAQESLVLVSYLHLLFLVTPYSMMDQIKLERQVFFDTYMSLGPKELQTAKVLGVTDQCIAQLMKPGSKFKVVSEKLTNRFYLSLILFELWNHKSVWQISTKYNITRGTVYNFLNAASAFASSVLRFCEELDEMWCFKQLLGDIPNRLTHCCTAELLPLMDLPAVKIGRAKQLFNAGYKSIALLAKADPKALVHAIDHLPRKVAHQIVATAKLMILAKAESLQEEAEDVLDALNSGNAVNSSFL